MVGCRGATCEVRITPVEKSRLITEINELLTPGWRTEYFAHVPLGKIAEIFEGQGFVLLQEDNTEWSGFLSGEDGRANISFARKSSETREGIFFPIRNSSLTMMWHRMESGNYEVVAYLG